MNNNVVFADSVEKLVQFFEGLKYQDLPDLFKHYAADANFKDPFNEVKGLLEIERLFTHMFDVLDSPHFIVKERIVQNNQCFLVWDFRFRFRRFDRKNWQTIRGGTHLMFNEQGLVSWHRDYWDAAEELYEKLPWIGRLMKWLKRHANG